MALLAAVRGAGAFTITGEPWPRHQEPQRRNQRPGIVVCSSKKKAPGPKKVPTAEIKLEDLVLKRRASWACIKNCGACCYLKPDERDLEEYLKDPEELKLYMSMVGEDGWCIHFDQRTRRCKIYDDRPRFCRVEPEVWKDMFGLEEYEMDSFACDCCVEQIGSVYGPRSKPMKTFKRTIQELNKAKYL
eukprot:jgi/Mesvir1/6058/Mv00791-RA.1